MVVLDDGLELVVLSELGVGFCLAEDPRQLAPDAAVPVDEGPVAVERRPALHGPTLPASPSGVASATMRRVLTLAVAAAGAALLLAAAGSPRAVKEGGTFRMALSSVGRFGTIDPALAGVESRLLRPACGALLSYPDKPLPAGLHLAPELAEDDPVISRDRKTYTFTIRKDARFSDGAPATAQAFVRALERLVTPAMQAGPPGDNFFIDILGARKMLAGKTTTLAGAVAKGRILRLRLTKPVPDLPARLSGVCAVPPTLPADPEGAKAPLPSPAPYFVSQYVPGERVVMARNRFYRGSRPHHVDRITIELGADASALERVERGELDHMAGTPDLNLQLADLVKRYGIDRSRVFVEPDVGRRAVFMNTTRPLFKNNVQVRQAINFAVDRPALVREYGRYTATPTDQYLAPVVPGFQNERIYPLNAPDLRRARALAQGRLRSGKAVLYTCSEPRPDCTGVPQVLERNLRAIGLDVEIKQFPFGVMLQKLATPGEPYDLVWIGMFAPYNDPSLYFYDIEAYSHYSSPEYDRQLAAAGRLAGPARYRAYGELDVQLARDQAPAIAAMNGNAWAFVSARTGCVVMNPSLDLTAVCVK
jgi:oligopeptide transport system substrate-binding protein